MQTFGAIGVGRDHVSNFSSTSELKKIWRPKTYESGHIPLESLAFPLSNKKKSAP